MEAELANKVDEIKLVDKESKNSKENDGVSKPNETVTPEGEHDEGKRLPKKAASDSENSGKNPWQKPSPTNEVGHTEKRSSANTTPIASNGPSVKETSRQQKPSKANLVDVENWPTPSETAATQGPNQIPNNIPANAGDNATASVKITKDQQEENPIQASPTAEESSQKVGKKKTKKWVPLEIDPVLHHQRTNEHDDRQFGSHPRGHGRHSNHGVSGHGGNHHHRNSNNRNRGTRARGNNKNRNRGGNNRVENNHQGYPRQHQPPYMYPTVNNMMPQPQTMAATAAAMGTIYPNYNIYQQTFYNQQAALYNPSLYQPVIQSDQMALKDAIRKQIEYYFSQENLLKDFYLRRQMNADGFIPAKTIAVFYRMQKLTKDVNAIVNAVSDSEVVEVIGDQLRCRIDPKKWPMQPEGAIPEANRPLWENTTPRQEQVQEESQSNVTRKSKGESGANFEGSSMPQVAQTNPPLPEAEKNQKDPDLTADNESEKADTFKTVKDTHEEKTKTTRTQGSSVHTEKWQEVRRKKWQNTKPSKKYGEKFTSQTYQGSNYDRELEFDLEEELQFGGRKKTFSEWSDDSDEEFDDGDVQKIIIITQTPYISKKHPSGDRTGVFTSRNKMTEQHAEIINEGLYYYEQDLQIGAGYKNEVSSCFKKVDVISSKEFESQLHNSDSYRKPNVQEDFPSFYVDKDQDSKDSSKSEGKSQEKRQRAASKGNKKTDAIVIGKGASGDKQRTNKSYDKVEARFYPLPNKSQSMAKKATNKQKTKYSRNPPVESHVGWVMGAESYGSKSSE
ncbi:uncharacterized protein TRIADDRAFT_56647 [Trichoplax adhaerens]|uniref:HTH La-type RNA-binding domain-containing protein n=1 Tax=Trichoplax adhaerens TaxID=10228 RepID=B3RYR2_TRIAD|nr:predicted protein [Trichoplax adhaerens]EDV24639.1 predicted protein [Trichoplax adhaerens]|eukprot:XP_002112529.1 predicted protein [Trichoplax adhaerens]